MLNGLWLALLGVLAASNLIIARKPEAKELIGKVAPYQGWIGAISAVWGAWRVIGAILHVSWMARYPAYWLTWLTGGVLLLCLGLLLGVGVIKTFIKQPEVNAKLDQVIAKLVPYQATLGIIGIVAGAWMFLSRLMHHH
jgi:hypothetical protein